LQDCNLISDFSNYLVSDSFSSEKQKPTYPKIVQCDTSQHRKKMKCKTSPLYKQTSYLNSELQITRIRTCRQFPNKLTSLVFHLQVAEDEMSGACSRNGGRRGTLRDYWWESQRERDH
jgi:hypothetical protein